MSKPVNGYDKNDRIDMKAAKVLAYALAERKPEQKKKGNGREKPC